jgi:23S rRNA pseudouridine1911/1915/1917 synthase
MPGQKYTFTAQEKDLNLRLDRVLVAHLPDRTRNFLQKLFEEEKILVDEKIAKPRTKLALGQKVEVIIPAAKELKLKPQKIPLDIVFENKDLLVINKPAGLVVHPGVGETHLTDSLVNAILHHCKGELSGISGVMRPGIVHRLDKDTSGLLIVAKNDQAHQDLALQLKNHHIEKTYYALLAGQLEPQQGSIEAPIGRSSIDRKKMAVVPRHKGKEALTHYKVLQYLKKDITIEAHYSFVEVKLITGRTHQIRVHFASIGHPIIGDPLYGREKLNNFFDQKFDLKRQFLHAGKIAFKMPGSGKKVEFKSELPEGLKRILEGLTS